MQTNSFRLSLWIASPSIILAILLSLLSCNNSSSQIADITMNYAEHLMWRNPDSALIALQTIDPVPGAADERARYALLLTQAQYRTGVGVKNDSLIREAATYYDTTSDSLRKAWAHYYWANYYDDIKAKDKSIQHFQIAESAALSTDDIRLLSLLYDNWGYMLIEIPPFEESLQLLLKAKHYYEMRNDSTGLIYNLRNIGWAYQHMEKEKEMHRYYKQAIDLADKIDRQDLKFLIYYHLSMYAEQRGDYNEAKRYILEAQRYINWKDKGDIDNLFAQKSYTYRGLHLYDSAQYYISKTDTSMLAGKAVYHMEMGDIKDAQHDYQAASNHYKLYATYLDSFYTERERQNVGETQKKYAYAQYQYENDTLKSEARFKNMAIVCISLGMVVISLMGYIIYIRMKHRKNEELREKTETLEHTKQLLAQTGDELDKERKMLDNKEIQLREALSSLQQLQNESKDKRNELNALRQTREDLDTSASEQAETTSRLQQLDLEIKEKEEQLASLQSQIETIESASKPKLNSMAAGGTSDNDTLPGASVENTLQDKLQELESEKEELYERVLRSNAVVRKLERLNEYIPGEKRRRSAELQLTPSERQELYNAVNYSYNNLEQRLRSGFPNLTDDDILTCCLVRLGICNSDIALLLNSSEDAFKKRKYRLRRDKLREVCKNCTLDEFLRTF